MIARMFWEIAAAARRAWIVAANTRREPSKMRATPRHKSLLAGSSLPVDRPNTALRPRVHDALAKQSAIAKAIRIGKRRRANIAARKARRVQRRARRG